MPMHAIAHSGVRSAIVAAGLVVAFLIPASVPVGAATPSPAPAPRGLHQFMKALAAVESGGRYTARNPVTGAYGAYQILPSNWPAWAARYLGNRKARPTPRNQDLVAAGRLTDLRRAYGSWDRTAYWWLTGRHGPRGTWSAYAVRYVNRIMAGYRALVASGTPRSRWTIDDRSASIHWAGTWRVARHRAYAGGTAHYATARGASAVVGFTGRSVRIIGATGPTRGRVQVLVDGKLVRTVDLRASHFHPRATIFATTWSTAGAHRVELRVLGTAGRPYVAVDQIVVGR
jgi:hypothetical protein